MRQFRFWPCLAALSQRFLMESGGVRLRNGLIVLSAILLLSSCAGLSAERAPVPTPVLESATMNDQGGICIDRDDTAELLHYLDAMGEN